MVQTSPKKIQHRNPVDGRSDMFTPTNNPTGPPLNEAEETQNITIEGKTTRHLHILIVFGIAIFLVTLYCVIFSNTELQMEKVQFFMLMTGLAFAALYYCFKNFKRKVKEDEDCKEILGKGSGGKIVYKSKFGRRDVAVKKIPDCQSNKEAENEIKILIECSSHKNIVQYYSCEEHFDGYRLILELCEAKTLKDWVINQDFLPVQLNSLDIIRQVTEGLNFLNTCKKIIHRDLKPSNILFKVVGESVYVKLSDFGISRLLAPGRISRTITSFGGTRGWIAAEMLKAEIKWSEMGTWNAPGMPKLTTKLDIFSLGCIFYFVLTNGHHPFGDNEDLYDHNIKRNQFRFKYDKHCLRLRCNLPLIQEMIGSKPEKRPDIEEILTHPILWSNQKMLNFLVELSNFIFPKPQSEAKKNCIGKLEKSYFKKISNGSEDGWFHVFKGPVRQAFEKRYKKDGNKKDGNKKVGNKKEVSFDKNSVEGLIRLIRNLNNHLDEEENQVIKTFVGEKPDSFMDFWLDKFPFLINEAREAFREFSGEPSLKQFYE